MRTASGCVRGRPPPILGTQTPTTPSNAKSRYSAVVRIVVSGTHASGKSTLISDFAAVHREYDVLPDPFELIDESLDAPSARVFLLQLQISAERLYEVRPDANVIAERAPLDFLAYLAALDETGRGASSDQVFERARALTATAMRQVDVLVLLPLNSVDQIWVPADEDHDLRDAMNGALLELSDDPDLVGQRTRVAELTGDRSRRLALLESSLPLLGTS